MPGIEIEIPCVLTVYVEADTESATTADLGKWVNDNHALVRASVERELRIADRPAEIGWLDDNHAVYLMDLVEVDAQIPRTFGVTTLEWS